MSGHKMKKNTLYFGAHAIYFFATDGYQYVQSVSVLTSTLLDLFGSAHKQERIK